MSGRLYDALVEAGRVLDADGVTTTINELRARHQVAGVAPYAGAPDRALDVARGQIVQVEDAERAIAWARQALPPLEQRLAVFQKAARGRWILPAVLVIIVLAVVVGQML